MNLPRIRGIAKDQLNNDISNLVLEQISECLHIMDIMNLEQKVSFINSAREEISKYSPFQSEPVDFVKWVESDSVQANDYNPNSVAPPEMELLRVSIMTDGYTQPIVAMQDGKEHTVIDGFHRNRVGKECDDVRKRIHGYLPVVEIRGSQKNKQDRIAATIRHNRARGKHQVSAMSDIVIELKNRNWTNERIARELGMDQDEILRLCQITGLADLFSDQEFSMSWDVEGEVTEADFEELTDDITEYDEEIVGVRTVNTSDAARIFHTYPDWECHKAGFYATTVNGMTKDQCEEKYREFLSDLGRFESALQGVISEWKHSCEHYLTNSAMNRIAWLGQASACYATGIPAVFRGGFSLLSGDEQDAANSMALKYLNIWLKNNDREELTMNQAYTGRQSDIY